MSLSRYRALWALTAGQRGRYAGAVAVMALETLLLMGPPLVVLAVVDGLLGDDRSSPLGRLGADLGRAVGSTPALWIAAAATLALTTASGACLALRGRWTALASEALVRDLRDTLYRHLDRLPGATLEQNDTGDLVQRCSSDVETLRLFLANQAVEIGRALLLILLATPVLASLDGPLTAASLGLLPLILGWAALSFGRIRRVFTDMDEAEAAMTTTLQENLTGIRVVRAFGRQDHERARFGEAAGHYRDSIVALTRWLGTYWSVSDLLCLSQLALSLGVGAARHLDGSLSLGTLVAFQTALGLVLWPVRQSGRVLADSGKAIVALDRIEEILEQEPEAAAPEVLAPSSQGPALAARGLRFAYGDGPPVLDGIDLDLGPGQTLALVGPPGAGKSTLVQLLLRLVDGYAGSLTADGVELSRLERKAWRARTAAVLQQPFLYARSVADNLRRARADASDEQLREALEAADLAHTVEALPDGLETLLGERGVTLSGGQRQRLAIARAWLRDAPLLILDDALSAVDTATETRILEALARRRGRCTTVLIAQRLSSIAHADLILVLEGGRVVQAGRHAELVAAAGPYARLWAVQSGLEAELRAPGDDDRGAARAGAAPDPTASAAPADATATDTPARPPTRPADSDPDPSALPHDSTARPAPRDADDPTLEPTP